MREGVGFGIRHEVRLVADKVVCVGEAVGADLRGENPHNFFSLSERLVVVLSVCFMAVEIGNIIAYHHLNTPFKTHPDPNKKEIVNSIHKAMVKPISPRS